MINTILFEFHFNLTVLKYYYFLIIYNHKLEPFYNLWQNYIGM